MTPLLKAYGLRKEFRIRTGRKSVSFAAVDHVDLEVSTGETLGLVGESGSGKTTLARCLIRLLEPTAGSIEFDGTDLLALSAPELRRKRREFQMIFQDASASLDPHMTLSQIISEPLEVQGMGTRDLRRTWVRGLMEGVGLDPALASHRPGLLSGGQQQRVAIARALALNPKLVIADEPVSALDASVQAQILGLLSDLRTSHGLTLLLISHSLPVVSYLADRIAVMYLGRIVEEAPTGEFINSPKHPYSQDLVASARAQNASPSISKSRLPGEIPSPVHPPTGCRFNPRCPHVRPRCLEEGPELVSISQTVKVACHLY